MGCLQKLLQMMCDPQGAGFHGGEVGHFITMVILPSEMVILPSTMGIGRMTTLW
jgi:hypothetical protein